MKVNLILIFALLGLSCTPQPRVIEETPLTPSPIKISTVDSVDTILIPTFASSVSISTSQSCPVDRNIFGGYSEFSSNASLVVLDDSQLSLLDIKTGEKKNL